MKIRLFLLCLVLIGLMWMVSCSGGEGDPEPTVGDKPDNIEYVALFKNASVFYHKIPENPPVDPNSAVMVTSLVDQANQAFLVVVKEWSVTIFFADAATPKQDVEMMADWAPKSKMLQVPIPDFAEPDPEEDGSMVIIDAANGCVYDFWEMRKSGGSWKAGWGNALPLSSDGIFEKGMSARGSGFELMQGLIWPQELAAGEIKHALIFSYDHTKAGGPVPPATESDGESTAAWAIPEGALVQLNPALDLSGLGLNAYETTIAKALQDYGMYCADDGGGISLYAVNPLSCKNNPYEDIWGDEVYVFLDKIPVDQFRVLALLPQFEPDPQVVANACTRFD